MVINGIADELQLPTLPHPAPSAPTVYSTVATDAVVLAKRRPVATKQLKRSRRNLSANEEPLALATNGGGDTNLGAAAAVVTVAVAVAADVANGICKFLETLKQELCGLVGAQFELGTA